MELEENKKVKEALERVGKTEVEIKNIKIKQEEFSTHKEH